MTKRNNPSFIVPYKGKSYQKSSSKPSKRTPSNDIKKAKMEIARKAKSSNALRYSKQLLDLMTSPNEVLAAKLALGAVENGIKSLANNSAKMLPYFYQQSLSEIDNTKVHIIRFNVGRESTLSVKNTESMNGSSNLQLSNSLSNSTIPVTRSYLAKSFGFNQKRIDFLGDLFYPVVKNYDKLFNLSSWNIPEHGTNVPYGLVKEEYSNVRIRNSNTYHDLKFKINIIKILDDDLSIEKIFNKVINQKSDVQDAGSIPMVYQISDLDGLDNRSNTYMKSVLCHYGVSLNKSTAFLTQAQIVKTFTKTLSPGDTLDFRMLHHMGPGIRLDIAQTYMLAAAKGMQPSGYGIIIESEGTLCQGMRIKDKSVFQGKCPGWYNYEYSKGIKLVKSTQLITNDKINDNSLKYAVKSYEREYLVNAPITFNSDIIGKPGEKGKEFTILSTSKDHVVFGSNISDEISNKETNIVELESDFDEQYTNESYQDIENEE